MQSSSKHNFTKSKLQKIGIVVIYGSGIMVMTLLILAIFWVSADTRFFQSQEYRHTILQTLLATLQLPAILIVAYEIRRQLDQRRIPSIKVGVKAGYMEFHQIPQNGELPLTDKIVQRNGTFTVLIRNDGDANLEGMSINIYPKSERQIHPPDKVHMYDRSNRRVWHSTPLLNRLVRKERLTIVFESDRHPDHGSGEFLVGVIILGDNLAEPVETTLKLTHGIWDDVIEG